MSKGHIVKVLFILLWIILVSVWQGFCFGLWWEGPVTRSSLRAVAVVPSPLLGSYRLYLDIS